MDSNKLRHFITIAEQKSMTKAADILFISQPALSKSLSVLEQELGCQLFNRIKRRLYINENGKKLLKYAYEVESIFKKINEDFAQHNVRVLSICSVGNFFPFVLKEYFRDGMRPIKLNVVPDTAIPELLFSGDVDVAIADDYYLNFDPGIGLCRISMLQEQLLLSVPHSHALAKRKRVNINELENERIMQTTTSNEINNWLHLILELNNVNINWSTALDSDTWTHYMYNFSKDMPPCFESSSYYLSSKDYRQAHNNRVLLKVEGIYTNRTVYLWYFEKKREFLSEFLESVKKVYTL